MNPSDGPSPELFWSTLTGFQHSAALKAAIELEVFTAIDNGSRSAAAIASATGAAERGIRILCDSLAVIGLLTKAGIDYSLTQDTAFFLSKKSPAYVGSVTDFIMSPTQRRGFDDLTDAVKRGGSNVTGEASLDPESPMWITFARAMMPMMRPAAEMIAARLGLDKDTKLKVLDIAAGHGIFGITVAQKYPNAEVYALDWKNVLAVAQENAECFNVASRFHQIAGSAFDTDFGGDYDVVLLPNFLHHFDPPTCETLVRKIGACLNADGKLMTLEFVPNDDRISPPSEALFALVMLAATPAGDAYTFDELKNMFESSGFSRNEHVPLDPLPQHLVVSMK